MVDSFAKLDFAKENMEVCYKCHQEIKPDDKYIIGDPNKTFKSMASSLAAGLNGDKNNIPQVESCKYHIECYKTGEKV